MSGLIFAALAVGWAIYLIPKALQHGDEVVRSRSVETFSQRMRVIGGLAEPAPAPEVAPAPRPAPAPISRAAAARAASKRRRVLGVLLGLTAIVAGVAAFGYLPWLSVAAPAALVVAFLIVARMTVRRQSASRRLPVDAASPLAEPARVEAPDETGVAAPVELATEETVGVSRADLAAAVAQAPLADEGSLWDPLPMNLPTYVGKPAARRTVRTIALTQTASSGHSAADSELVRKAEAEKSSAADAPSGETRKAAGA